MTDHNPSAMNPAFKIILGVVGALLLLTCIGIALTAKLLQTGVEAYQSEAEVQSTNTQMRQLEAAITTYRLTYRALPESLDVLAGEEGFTEGEAVPTDAWGNEFIYVPDAEAQTFVLTSLGADGVEGGERIDADLVIVSGN
jgi:general secretion pathway protein G